MKSVAIFLGCLSLLLLNVNGCGVPCTVGSPDELAGNCCNRGACGCVKMLGTTAGCDDVPGPGSCTVPSLMSTTDTAETCPYPTTYVEGVGCADICGTIVGIPCPSDSQTCYYQDPTGQCADCGGVCLEPVNPNGACTDPYDQTVDNPFDCQLASSGLYCSQICVSGSSASRICEDTEQFQICGTACPRKCGDPDDLQCLAVCERFVCRCADGYVLDEEDGECILESECPMDSTVSPMTTDDMASTDMGSTDAVCCDRPVVTAGRNPCSEGCACCPDGTVVGSIGDGKTFGCDNGDLTLVKGVDDDKFGEFCDSGLISTEDPVVCGENEEVKACGTACPAKCGDIGPLPCIALCEVNVCRCKDGYILDVEDGECIPEDECPTEEPEPETTVVCGENEELKDCGTACPKKCGDSGLTICAAVCQLNVCRCMDGYVLDEEDGECILEEECPTEEPVIESTEEPAICGDNEELKACGTACPAKCGDSGLIACAAVCQLNVCRCKDGFILDEADGVCIPEDECPTEEPIPDTTTICGENEELKACGTACPKKCGDSGLIACAAVCQLNVCRCKDGYILDEEDGECIPEDECPMGSTEEPASTEVTECEENEELQACGTACPRKCGDAQFIPCIALCELNVCRCKDGYILDEEDGECILEDECPTEEPTVCGDNEELQACGTACPRTCEDDGPIICLAVCEPNVCRCKDGFILDEEDGDCIPEDECPMGSTTEEPEIESTEVVCGENEELQACGTACPRTCEDDGPIICLAVCRPNVCRCKDGFILDEEDGECIPEDQCPMGSTTEAPFNETEIEVTDPINPSDANTFGLLMVFGVIVGVFGWM